MSEPIDVDDDNGVEAFVVAPSQHLSRLKTDAGWKYVTEASNADGKKSYVCNICKKMVSGGGITRMKRHIAGVKGDVGSCKDVSPEV